MSEQPTTPAPDADEHAASLARLVAWLTSPEVAAWDAEEGAA